MVPSRDRKDGVEAEERTTRRSAVAAAGMSRGSKEMPIRVSEMSSITSRKRCRREECIDEVENLAQAYFMVLMPTALAQHNGGWYVVDSVS